MHRAIRLLLPLLLALPASAQVINAASCNQADVATALAAVVPSTTTVNIPAGNCTWTSDVTLNVPSTSTTLSIQGQTVINGTCAPGGTCTATDATVITDNDTTDFDCLFCLYTGTTNSLFRLTGITFKSGTGNIKQHGVVNMQGFSQNLRMDHNHFLTNVSGADSNQIITISGWQYGVVDHNFFDGNSAIVIFHQQYGNTNGLGNCPLYCGVADGSWADSSHFGGPNAVFIENNFFNSHVPSGGAFEDCYGGGRFVVRYNVGYGESAQTHPTGGSGRDRGCRANEVYANDFEPSTFGTEFNISYASSGTALFWGNTIHAAGYSIFFSLHNYLENNDTYSQTATPNGWGYCGTAFNGTASAWNFSTSTATGVPCIDQVGRGQSDQLQGEFPNACDTTTGCSTFNGTWPNQKLEPLYEWMDTVTGSFTGSSGTFHPQDPGLTENQDYYGACGSLSATCTGAFDGTKGTGFGTFAARPATCTAGPSGSQFAGPTGHPGVAYWATDQQQLYVCTAANTWTAYYAPYQYPHPLDNGGGGPPSLGQNCTNGCGIGTHILPSTLTVTLCDTANPGCASTIPAQKNVANYPTLPATINAQAMNFDWQTDVPANGYVVCGSLLNNSDSIQFDSSSPGVYNIGITHHVTFTGLVPASHGGNGGGGMTCYVGDNINATSSDPQQRYATGQNTWPGPQCYAGSTNCYLNFFPPNPTASLPMQWTANQRGIINATRGYPAQIPLMLLWNGGNGTTAPSSCSVANQLFHTYQAGQWSAPNNTNWYKCDGAHFVSMGSTLPVFAVTGNAITDPSANTYTCPGSVNGGESASGIPRTVADTCLGTAGDSHISVTPFYTGAYVSGSSSTDYRQIFYNAAHGWYYFNTNGAAPPSNPVPVSTVQFFPAANAPTGNFTGTVTLTMYTDSSLTTLAAGTSPITFNYSINVSDDAPIAQVDPVSYPADTNLPSWMNYLSQQSIYMCSNASGPDSMDYYNLGIQYWMWLTFSGGDWGPYQTGNYDNARVFAAAPNVFLKKMDGTAWPAWASGTTYGTSQSTMEVTDTNGHVWLATVNGGTSGGSISWPANPTAGSTKTDNTQTWRYVGDAAYWNRCTENASVPFDNQSIQAGGTPDWAKFSGAEEMHRLRTGNAILKGTTTYQGFYSNAESKQVGLGGGYWSEYSPAAGRGSAYRGMALATIWQADCDAGNCGAFTNSDELKRAWFWNINACIEFLQIHQLSNPLSTDPTQTAWPTFDPLHVGVCQESLREMYITDLRLDPTNALGLADARLIPEMTKFADFAYFHFYNQCRVQGEGTDNWSMSYNPMDVQQCKYTGQQGISEPYYTELVGPGATIYPFLGRYNGNALMSDASTHWFAASDIILKHVYDGRNCSNPQGNWFCQSYSAPYAGASGVPKAFGQGAQREMGNFYQYRTGAYTPFEDDLSPTRNPCWTGGSVPCTTPSPYPDTEAPYGVQLHAGLSEQDDPTCEAHYTGDATCSPIINITGTSAVFRIRFYEPLASLRVDYGTDQTCTGGSSSTEVAGYPQTLNTANQLHEDQIQLSGLTPSTTYYARYCSTDLAHIQSCNTCTAIPGGFRGGAIRFITAAQTQLAILTASPLPNGALNVPYSQQMQAAGGTPPYTWTYTGTLPTGLTLPTTGLLSGTPTQSGTFTINVSVADNAGNHAGPVVLSLTITNLTIVTSSLPNATSGLPYDQTLIASGGVTPYTWAALNPIPPNLVLTPSSGEIQGTPSSASCRTWSIQWRVTDAQSTVVSRTIPITVTGCAGNLTLTCPPFPNGTVNVAYPATSCVIGGGGVSPYSCSITAGALPAGMNVAASGAACVVSGTPTATGPASFTITATDSTTPTPLTATAPGSFTVISTGGQFGLTVNGSVSMTGSATLGTPAPAPPPGSPVGP